MRIIKKGKQPKFFKRITCDCCQSIFDFERYECAATSQLGVLHEGLPSYHVTCPVCKNEIYFEKWTNDIIEE